MEKGQSQIQIIALTSLLGWDHCEWVNNAVYFHSLFTNHFSILLILYSFDMFKHVGVIFPECWPEQGTPSCFHFSFLCITFLYCFSWRYADYCRIYSFSQKEIWHWLETGEPHSVGDRKHESTWQGESWVQEFVFTLFWGEKNIMALRNNRGLNKK